MVAMCYNCPVADDGPVCGRCWKQLSWEAREDIKTAFNDDVSEGKHGAGAQLFCDVPGCWNLVKKRKAAYSTEGEAAGSIRSVSGNRTKRVIRSTLAPAASLPSSGRPRCACRCGCKKQPGRRIVCRRCGARIGPGCCATNHTTGAIDGICHLCTEQRAPLAQSWRFSLLARLVTVPAQCSLARRIRGATPRDLLMLELDDDDYR